MHHELARQHKQAVRRQRKLARVRRRSHNLMASPHHQVYSSDGEERVDTSRQMSGGVPMTTQLQLPDEAFPFRRVRGALYAAPRGPLPNYRQQHSPAITPFHHDCHDRFQLTRLHTVIHSHRIRLTAYMRQRTARGGRRVFDVARVPADIETYLSWRDSLFGVSCDSDSSDSNEDIGISVFKHRSRMKSAPLQAEVRTIVEAEPPLSDRPTATVEAAAAPASVMQGQSSNTEESQMSCATAAPRLDPAQVCSTATANTTAVPSTTASSPAQHNGIAVNSAARLPPASASTLLAKAREQLQHQPLQQLNNNNVGSSDGGGTGTGTNSLGLSTEPAANIKQLNYPLSLGNALHGLGVVGYDGGFGGAVVAVGHPRILKMASAPGAHVTPPAALCSNRRKRKSESEFVVVTSDSEMDVS